MDVIAIRGLRVMGRHGANPGERELEQPFDIELELEADLSPAAASDELRDTIDYDVLQRRIRAIVRGESFALLERLAAAILDETFLDERVRAASVSIAKPQVLEGATASVTLRRRRESRS